LLLITFTLFQKHALNSADSVHDFVCFSVKVKVKVNQSLQRPIRNPEDSRVLGLPDFEPIGTRKW